MTLMTPAHPRRRRVTNRTVLLLCEGAACNAGRSAADRRATWVLNLGRIGLTADDLERRVAASVTLELQTVGGYHPHQRTVRDLGAYACMTCGHVRKYGNDIEDEPDREERCI